MATAIPLTDDAGYGALAFALATLSCTDTATATGEPTQNSFMQFLDVSAVCGACSLCGAYED